MNAHDLVVKDLRRVLLRCSGLADSSRYRIATRRFRIKGVGYLLLVDAETLVTSLEREDCSSCNAIEFSSLSSSSRFGIAIETFDQGLVSSKGMLVNAGLKAVQAPMDGVVITADLCPTPKALNHDFFKSVERLQENVPVALSVSGTWLKRHPRDLDWIKGEVAARRIQVTWVNHSLHHYDDEDEPDDHNFMLLPKTDATAEVLGNERIMIENGITPSVFFRFPALISDRSLMDFLKKNRLIALGANAWLAKGQRANHHALILVHANGNEPDGIHRLQQLIENRKVPLPVLPVNSAPSTMP